MSQSTARVSISPGPNERSARSCGEVSGRSQWYLPVETVLVTILAILAVRILTSSRISGLAWFAAPGILVAAALVPTALRRDEFADIGFSAGRIREALSVVCRTCAVVFPATFLVLWLLGSSGLRMPLRPFAPESRQWLNWFLYQLMYVAVAEEIFFRGYLQDNILRLTNGPAGSGVIRRTWPSVVLSAVVFALAHVVVQGRAEYLLTFLPGLVLGWLFVKTRSLLAPILFHGLANVSYCLMAAAIS